MNASHQNTARIFTTTGHDRVPFKATLAFITTMSTFSFLVMDEPCNSITDTLFHTISYFLCAFRRTCPGSPVLQFALSAVPRIYLGSSSSEMVTNATWVRMSLGHSLSCFTLHPLYQRQEANPAISRYERDRLRIFPTFDNSEGEPAQRIMQCHYLLNLKS